MYRLICVFILLSIVSSAQIIRGKIVDQGTKSTLPYVGIGIVHTNIGTLTNDKGYFKLDITHVDSLDTLVISNIGYIPIIIPLSDYKKYKNSNDSIFELEPKSETLNECIITAGKQKNIIIGNTVKSGVICVGFSSNELGTEVGTVLKYHRKKVGKIQNLNFNLLDYGYDSSLFRINIYKYRNGKIGEPALKNPLYLKISAKNQSRVQSIDLRDSNIYINTDVILCLEWVKNYKNSDDLDYALDSLQTQGIDKIHFCASFLGNDSYIRKGCAGDWKKCPVCIGFWATVTVNK